MSNLDLIFSNPNILSILKIAILLAISIYALVAFVVFKQTKLMKGTFGTPYGAFFIILALIHFIAVIVVLVLALIIL
jgi:ABC-type multidrug transport system permease subunit